MWQQTARGPDMRGVLIIHVMSLTQYVSKTFWGFVGCYVANEASECVEYSLCCCLCVPELAV